MATKTILNFYDVVQDRSRPMTVEIPGLPVLRYESLWIDARYPEDFAVYVTGDAEDGSEDGWWVTHPAMTADQERIGPWSDIEIQIEVS